MARAHAPDYREFIRVSVDLPLNPKLAVIDEPAAGWAYVVALCYCGQNLTDGSFPMPVVLRLAGVEPAVARLLLDVGLWHETGHTCERCPQPMSGMGVVHDYLSHQRSAEEAKTLRDARREAGRKGAASRWADHSNGKSHSNGHGKSHARAMANGWQADGKPMAEVEVEVNKKKTSSSSSATAEPPRDDVEQLVARLRDRLRENEFKLPASFQEWRRHARLLLDRDGRELGQALRLIDWATSHHFWMGNIRSMSKFRAQYDTLITQARNEYRQGASASQPANRVDEWQRLKQTGTDGRALFAITTGEQQ